MKKRYLALMCAAGLLLAAACGGGNANAAAENGENAETARQQVKSQAPADNSLAGTTWKCREDISDPYVSHYEYVLTFGQNGESTYTITGYDKSGNVDNSVSDKLSGTYTYDNERGTVDYGKCVDPGSFYIDGGKLTIDVRYERHTLEQVK